MENPMNEKAVGEQKIQPGLESAAQMVQAGSAVNRPGAAASKSDNVWADLPATVTQTNGFNLATVPAIGNSQFFRLVLPPQ
jgi:hypothetical protein